MGRPAEMWAEICTQGVGEEHRRGGGQSSDGRRAEIGQQGEVLAGAGETGSEKERCL